MNARELRANNFSQRLLNPRINIGLNTSYNGSADLTQNPTVGRPGRSTDFLIPVDRDSRPKKPESWGLSVRVFRSTGSVDPENPRVGICQSGTAVDRAGRPLQPLCMLCTSVDRPGRPTLLISAAAAISCHCLFAFHRRLPWRSSTASTALGNGHHLL